MKTFFKILLSPFIFLAIYIIARMMFCHPGGNVVKYGVPFLQQVGEKIVEQGSFQNSFADLEGLPYTIDECHTTFDSNSTNQTNDAIGKTEICTVTIKGDKYSIRYDTYNDLVDRSPIEAYFLISNSSHTLGDYGVKYSKKLKRLVADENVSIRYMHTGLLCSSFKQ